jgi:dihydrofolate reductase
MRKVVVVTQMTLDGVMQAPGGPEEDPSGGFEQGGWSVNYWDEVLEQAIGEGMARPFDLLLGRKTYEIFAAHWPYADGPAADRLNSATKHVASRTLERLDWSNSTLIEGEVATAVAQLKAEDGPELQVHGSWELIQTLLAYDLIDEFRLWIFPVLVGPGKRLFGDVTVPAGLTLVVSKTSTTGVIIATYQPAGQIQLGSFAFEDPTEEEIERRARLDTDESASLRPDASLASAADDR